MPRFGLDFVQLIPSIDSSHVAEPLAAKQNVVQRAHRNTPRPSLGSRVDSSSHADQLPPALFACPRNGGPNGIDAALSRVHRVSRYLHPPQRYLENAWDFLSIHGYSPEFPKAAPPPAP
ncbi:hypothetical protein V8C42DRAFT_348626 [Trichoderma barbatum]